MVQQGRMMVLVLALAVAAGCARTTTTSGGSTTSPSTAANATGASSARGAVDAFMAAVKAQDLQLMSTLWGTAKGPAREQMERDELEKRLVIMHCYMQHDNWSFAEDNARLQAGGRQEFAVELRKKGLRAKTTFTTVRGPMDRWYVEIVDVQPLRDFCS